jgi:hypothetical protein
MAFAIGGDVDGGRKLGERRRDFGGSRDSQDSTREGGKTSWSFLPPQER